MSLSGKRDALATALSGVPGVQGFAYRPTTPVPGNAWPLLGPMDRAAGTAFVASWRIRVLLPQDERAATDWLDTHWPALFFALEAEGSVDRAIPTLLPVAGGDQYAFEITLRAEE